MNEIKFPIIIAADGSIINIYDSCELAASDMEAIDVADNDYYIGFDAEGRLLKIQTVDEQGNPSKPTEGKLFGLLPWAINDKDIQITLAEETPSRIEELKKLIIEFLKISSHEAELTLRELIEKCLFEKIK